MSNIPKNSPADNVRHLSSAKASYASAPEPGVGPLSDDEAAFLEKWRQLGHDDRARVQRLLFRWCQRGGRRA
jgi:hypothetical protein